MDNCKSIAPARADRGSDLPGNHKRKKRSADQSSAMLDLKTLWVLLLTRFWKLKCSHNSIVTFLSTLSGHLGLLLEVCKIDPEKGAAMDSESCGNERNILHNLVARLRSAYDRTAFAISSFPILPTMKSIIV